MLALLSITALTQITSGAGLSAEEKNAQLNDTRPKSLYCHVYRGSFDDTQLQLVNGQKVGSVQVQDGELTVSVRSVGLQMSGEITNSAGVKLTELSDGGGELFSSHLFADGRKISVSCAVTESDSSKAN
ncbi:MAG: hypothetical protein H7256_02370 [Bdellovibrio sp.]|nr:hypothetical protein [Bdellovibrio sp.]